MQVLLALHSCTTLVSPIVTIYRLTLVVLLLLFIDLTQANYSFMKDTTGNL